MFSKLLPVALVLALLPGVAVGQEGGGGGGGGFQGGGSGLSDGGLNPRALTPVETFMARLKLDEKTQVPQAQEILGAAAREAAPLSTQLLQLRQSLLNAEISKDPAVIKQAIDAYAATAAKLSSIEGHAFAKVYALLKPNQTSKAGDAFELLPVILAPGTPARGGGMGGRRGGGM